LLVRVSRGQLGHDALPVRVLLDDDHICLTSELRRLRRLRRLLRLNQSPSLRFAQTPCELLMHVGLLRLGRVRGNKLRGRLHMFGHG
jgi:hypothetical protein